VIDCEDLTYVVLVCSTLIRLNDRPYLNKVYTGYEGSGLGNLISDHTPDIIIEYFSNFLLEINHWSPFVRFHSPYFW
jgi:hypothetical protein